MGKGHKKRKKKGKVVQAVDDEPRNEVKTDITLTIEEEPYIEMMQYAHEFSPNECSGVGLVERLVNGDGSIEFNVTKVYVPLQTNSAVSTDIEDEELNKLNTQLVEDGEDTSLLKFHWHSHVDMSVFHSGTDDENYDDMQTGNYAVSLVVNKDYDMLGSVHIYSPIRIDVLNIDVAPPQDVDLDEYKIPKDLRKKIEANVAKVEEHEESKVVIHQPRGTHYTGLCPKCHCSYYYCNCAYDAIGGGLVCDPDFIRLLVAGEEQGIITLLYDETDATICGYMNTRTFECYELTSMLDYSNYSQGLKKINNSSIGGVHGSR